MESLNLPVLNSIYLKEVRAYEKRNLIRSARIGCYVRHGNPGCYGPLCYMDTVEWEWIWDFYPLATCAVRRTRKPPVQFKTEQAVFTFSEIPICLQSISYKCRGPGAILFVRYLNHCGTG